MKLLDKFGYGSATVAPRFFSLLMLTVLTNMPDKEIFGKYSLIIMFGELIDASIFNALRMAQLRFGIKGNSRKIYLYKKSIVFQLIVGLIVIIAGIFALSYFNINQELTILILIYALSNGAYKFFLNVVRCADEKKLYVLSEMIKSPLSVAVALFLYEFYSKSIGSIIAGILLINISFSVFIYKKINKFSEIKSDGATRIKSELFFAAPLFGVFLLTQLSSLIDRLIIVNYGSLVDFGIYSAAISLSKPFIDTVFIAFSAKNFVPIIKNYEDKNIEKVNYLIKTSAKKSINMTILAYFVMVFFAPFLLKIILGKNFYDSINVVAVTGISAIFLCCKNFIFDQVFHLEKNSYYQMISIIPGILLGGLFSYMWYRKNGIIGAAWGGVLGSFFSMLISFYLGKNRIKIEWPVYHMVKGILICFIIYAIKNYIVL